VYVESAAGFIQQAGVAFEVLPEFAILVIPLFNIISPKIIIIIPENFTSSLATAP